MGRRTLRQLLVTATVLFFVGTFLPGGGIGCLHHESLGFGLPLPWLTIDVKYGRPIPSGDFYAQGPIEGIEGLGIDWISVPADLAAMLALSAMCVGVGKGGAGAVRWFRNRGQRRTRNNRARGAGHQF